MTVTLPRTATEPSPAGPSTGVAGHPRRRAILAVLCLSLLVVIIDNTVLNTALPTLARVLPAGTSALQWITDAYTLCFASLLIPAGALSDRFGRRRTLVGGLIVFALGSLAAAFAPGAHWLVADRVVMGLGAAFVMPSTLSILNDVFPAPERSKAIAAWSAVAGVGIVIGPTLGGALLSHFFWGSVFLINLPLVAVALAAIWRVVPESADPRRGRLDWVGTALVGLALVAVIDAIIEAPTRGWLSPVTLAETAVGLGLLGAFVRYELRTAHPLIDLRVFASRAFSAAAGAVTIIFFALFGSLFALTQYLQLVHGYTPFGAGVRALPFALAMGAVAPVSTTLAARLGSRSIIAAGIALMGLGLAALSTLHVDSGYPPMAVMVAVMGAGMGLVMAPASTTIMASVPEGQAGAASAVNDTIREVGGALGVAVIGSLVAGHYGTRVTAVLDAHHAPGAVTRLAASSVAAGDAVAHHVGGAVGGQILSLSHQAYVSGMADGMRVAAGVAFVGALVIGLVLPGRATGGLATFSLADTAPTAVPRPQPAATATPAPPSAPARTLAPARPSTPALAPDTYACPGV